MIEWVPIKEFLQQVGESDYLLVCDAGLKFARVVCLQGNKDLLLANYTHAARINFPVEKTLEQKFEEFQYEQSCDVTMRTLRQGFAQIAKEHYEVKQ